VKRWLHVLSLAVVGCSSLDEGDAGIVALELQTPTVSTLEIGETVQLKAVALNKDGQAVDVPITWRTPDTTVTVDGTGLVTAVKPGTGQVQASAGPLTSELVGFTILAQADTLIIVGDSIVSVPAVPGTTGPLVVRLETFGPPPGPLASRPVVYQITGPSEALTSVVLPGGVVIDTLQTGADGTVSTATLSLVAGATAPDSAIVEVRASRAQGALVPGSGQRFIVRYE
jgi:Bacterial Ig-like domain (group 2)